MAFLDLNQFSFEEIERLPFNVIIRSLNKGELDTFEIGSVKLPKVTAPPTKKNFSFLEEDELVREILNRKPIDLAKFDEEEDEKKSRQVVVVPKNKQLGFKKRALGHDSTRVQVSSNVSDEPKKKNGSKKLSDHDHDPDEAQVKRILEEMTGFDLPPMLDDLDDSCIIRHQKKNVQVSTPQTFSNKLSEEISTTNAITRVSSTASMNSKKVSTGHSSCLTDHDVEMKLEASRRKLKKQYNEIENEKKRKRIEVIEYQQPPQIAQPSKKLKKPPAKKQQTSTRPSQLFRGRMN